MYKIFLIIFIILFSNQLCFSETLKKIDLKTAIDIALQNNIDIKSSEMDLEIAKNNIKISNRLQNPSIKHFLNFGRACEGNPNQIGLAQTIELFKRGSRKNLAKSIYDTESNKLEYNKFHLKMDVSEAYIKLVVAKFLLNKCRHQQDFHEKLLKISNPYNLKIEEETLDTIEAKIALNQIITEVNKAKANERTARIEFNKVINSLEGNYDSIDSELNKDKDIIGINIPMSSTKLPSFDEIAEKVIDNRLDIKIAKNEIETSKKNLTMVIRQRIPDIEISGGYGYQPARTSPSNQFESGAYLEASIVNIPILYAYRPEIRNAKIEIEKANLNYISTVNKARKDIEIAYEKFVTAKINLDSYNDKIFRESEKLFNLFEKIYKVKKLDFASLAAVEESYQDLIVGYSEAISDYYIGWINFLREIYSDNFVFEQVNTSL